MCNMQIIYKLVLSIVSWMCFLIQNQLDGVQRNETESRKMIFNRQCLKYISLMGCQKSNKM